VRRLPSDEFRRLCHTPERRLIFDINDLDETLPAPREWDVKRLVASFVLAARANGLSDEQGRDAAVACARSYRRKMRDFTSMDVLDVGYARLDDSDFLAMLPKHFKKGSSPQSMISCAAPREQLVVSRPAGLSSSSGSMIRSCSMQQPRIDLCQPFSVE